MLETVARRVLRAVFGGGSDIDLASLLSRLTEVSVATGDATGGSTTTLVDTNAVWEVDKWKDAVVEITHAANSKHYFVTITSNTADTLTFPAIAVTVAADDHYEIRMTLRLADIDKWGGTTLTGRDISLDLKSLTDDSLKGLLKSIGDIATLENLITRIGQTSDAMVAAGATGSVAAKLRRVTQGLEDLKTLIVLAAGTAVIGKIRLVTAAGDEITDDTLDAAKVVEHFGGAVYENEDTATTDDTRRFEATSKKLRDVIISVTTQNQLFGNSANQRYPVTAGEAIGFTKVDLSTLYFKNAAAGQNGTVNILGVEE